jgi:serine protease
VAATFGAEVLVALGLLGVAGGAVAFQRDDAPAAVRGAPEADEPTDRLIVKYRSAANADGLDARALAALQVAGNRAGVRIARLRGNSHGGHVLRADRKLSLADARRLAAELRNGDADIEYAEPDRLLQAQYLPNDPSYSGQWHYSEAAAGIRLPQAWDKSTGAGVVVAVIDTGVRRHADLAANLVSGYDFITDTVVANDGTARDADPVDPGDWSTAGACGTGSTARNSSWHGTHVAGTIAAVTNNRKGVAGVAFGAKVQPVRVLGRCGGYTSDIADAIIWASGGTVTGVPANATPAKVINLSLGGAGACDITTQNAINSARSRGTVVVVAAGNSAADAANFSPASCAGVISVAAVGRTGGLASYSNFGASVDVAAPGGDGADTIMSTLNAGTTSAGTDSYAGYRGTSMATPHVAGIAALMLARNAALTPDQVEAHIKSTAGVRGFPLGCQLCGTGIVDANAAVDAALGVTAPTPNPTPTPVPPPAPTQTTVAEVEPNDTLAAPQKVTATLALINGTIGSATDADHYRVTVGPGKTLVATLTPNASSDYDLQAYNALDQLQVVSTNGTGVADRISLTNGGSAAVDLKIRVLYYGGGTGATAGKYTLSLSQ